MEVSVKESSQYVVSEIISTVQTSYARQESTDSDWENPFRPDGNLSKEADEIVELIKEGKPITPTQTVGFGQLDTSDSATGHVETTAKQNAKGQLSSTPESKANGSLISDSTKPVTGVEVQAGTAPTPADPSQVEHVVLKKKPICKCCIIQ